LIKFQIKETKGPFRMTFPENLSKCPASEIESVRDDRSQIGYGSEINRQKRGLTCVQWFLLRIGMQPQLWVPWNSQLIDFIYHKILTKVKFLIQHVVFLSGTSLFLDSGIRYLVADHL